MRLRRELMEDRATKVFGRHGQRTPTETIDLALGAVRGIPELRGLWNQVLHPDAGLVPGVEDYPGTQGPGVLLEAFATLWERERGALVEPGQFVATHGALDALGHALMTLPLGSPVFFAVPGFDYRLPIARAGCRPVPILWRLGDTLGAFLDSLEVQLYDADADGESGIIVCFPSNPGGVVPDTEDWARLRTLANRHNALLVVDDIYRFSARCTGDTDGHNMVVVDSLSKRLGAPGLRLGYAWATGRRLALLRSSMGMSSVGVSSVVAAVGAHALRRYLSDPSIAASIHSALAERREQVRGALPDWLAPHLHLPDSGLYGCLQTPGVEAARLKERLRTLGILVTLGTDLLGGLPPDDTPEVPFIRFCVGSDPRIDTAFRIIVDELCPSQLARCGVEIPPRGPTKRSRTGVAHVRKV